MGEGENSQTNPATPASLLRNRIWIRPIIYRAPLRRDKGDSFLRTEHIVCFRSRISWRRRLPTVVRGPWLTFRARPSSPETFGIYGWEMGAIPVSVARYTTSYRHILLMRSEYSMRREQRRNIAKNGG